MVLKIMAQIFCFWMEEIFGLKHFASVNHVDIVDSPKLLAGTRTSPNFFCSFHVGFQGC